MATATATKIDPRLPPTYAQLAHTHLAEHRTQNWYHIASVPYERVLASDYWGKQFAGQMALHDKVDAYDVNGLWAARLLVIGVDASRGHISVVERHPKLDLKPIVFEPLVHGDMIAQYEGPHRKWTVRRQTDRVLLGGKHHRPQRSEASDDDGSDPAGGFLIHMRIASALIPAPRETLLTAKLPGRPVRLGQPVFFGETPVRIIHGTTAPE